MFGKPQWFRPKTVGWGVTPITWQGWLYSLGWSVAIAIPFVLLIWRHQPLEAGTWLALGGAALWYDVRQILCALRGGGSAATATTHAAASREDSVLYIGDSQAGPVATRNYNLQLRQ